MSILKTNAPASTFNLIIFQTTLYSDKMAHVVLEAIAQ
jgi:hypothetical protein